MEGESAASPFDAAGEAAALADEVARTVEAVRTMAHAGDLAGRVCVVVDGVVMPLAGDVAPAVREAACLGALHELYNKAIRLDALVQPMAAAAMLALEASEGDVSGRRGDEGGEALQPVQQTSD